MSTLPSRRLRLLVADDQEKFLRIFLKTLGEVCLLSPVSENLRVARDDIIGDDGMEIPEIRNHFESSLIKASYTKYGEKLISQSKSSWDVIITDFKFEYGGWPSYFLAALFPFVYNAHRQGNIVIKIYSQFFSQLESNELDLYGPQGEHVFEMIKMLSGSSRKELVRSRPKLKDDWIELLNECLRERQLQILSNEYPNIWLLSSKLEDLRLLMQEKDTDKIEKFLTTDCNIFVEEEKVGLFDLPLLPYEKTDNGIKIFLPEGEERKEAESFWRVKYLFPQVAKKLHQSLESEDFDHLINAIDDLNGLLFSENLCIKLGDFWTSKREDSYMFSLTHLRMDAEEYTQHATLAYYVYEKELKEALPQGSAKHLEWWLSQAKLPDLNGDIDKQRAMAKLVNALFRNILECSPEVDCENCPDNFLECSGFRWACRLENLLEWIKNPSIPLECEASYKQTYDCSECSIGNKLQKPKVCGEYILPAIVKGSGLRPEVKNTAKRGAYFDVLNFLKVFKGIVSGISDKNPDNKTVRIEIYEEDKDLFITIEDYGEGFDEPIKKAFQRYKGEPGQELRDIAKRLKGWCAEAYVETRREESNGSSPYEIYSLIQRRNLGEEEIRSKRKKTQGTKYTLIIKRG